MSRKTNLDSIVFEYPGSVEEFYEEFISPNDKYEVTLRPYSSTNHRILRNPTSGSLFYLSIKWTKMCSKFIRIKVHDIATSRILLKEKILKVSKASVVHKYLVLDKKPAVFVIKICTYVRISKRVHRDQASIVLLTKSDINPPLIKTEFQQLSSEIRVLLDAGTFSDVTITDGENKMHLHKIILSARSSVFNKMFQHPTKEKQESMVHIKDISFDVLRVLVDYMYSGVAKIDDMEMARNLFIAADKYDVQKLREICLAKLKCISLENVLDNLLLGNFYGEKDLKDSAFTYISENYSKVQNLQNWNKFAAENKDLAIEILSYVLNQKTE